jgi:cysteinyl-tRNA synthetase
VVHLHEIAGAINRARSGNARRQLQLELAGGGKLLGLLSDDPKTRLRRTRITGQLDATLGDASLSATGILGEAPRVEERIAERTQARKERRFDDADRIRAELAAEGIVLEDRPDGTTDWRRA